jgi:hypothetical protein
MRGLDEEILWSNGHRMRLLWQIPFPFRFPFPLVVLPWYETLYNHVK